MKPRFSLFRRGRVFYSEDSLTGKQQSLRTADADEAKALLQATNEATRQPAMNLQIAQIYWQHGDPVFAARTWENVMEAMSGLKRESTLKRWQHAIRDKAFDLIRKKKLIDTRPEHFLDVLNSGTVSTNMFLRRIHNFALALHWLPWPVLPKNRQDCRHSEHSLRGPAKGNTRCTPAIGLKNAVPGLDLPVGEFDKRIARTVIGDERRIDPSQRELVIQNDPAFIVTTGKSRRPLSVRRITARAKRQNVGVRLRVAQSQIEVSFSIRRRVVD
jgi:hypothetical protein